MAKPHALRSMEASLQDLKDGGNICCLRSCINLLNAAGLSVDEIPAGSTCVYIVHPPKRKVKTSEQEGWF